MKTGQGAVLVIICNSRIANTYLVLDQTQETWIRCLGRGRWDRHSFYHAFCSLQLYKSQSLDKAAPLLQRLFCLPSDYGKRPKASLGFYCLEKKQEKIHRPNIGWPGLGFNPELEGEDTMTPDLENWAISMPVGPVTDSLSHDSWLSKSLSPEHSSSSLH